MKLVLITIGVLVVEGVIFFKVFSGEKERIKTLFRIYKGVKSKYFNMKERELLEIVVEEHIPPGEVVQLRKTGFTGK